MTCRASIPRHDPALIHPPSELLERVCAHDPLCSGAPLRPLKGGRSNHVWRIDGAKSYVLKIYDLRRQSPLFANNMQAEVAALRYFGPRGMAPSLVTMLEHPIPAILYEYVEGDAASPFEIGRALSRIHAHRPALGLQNRPPKMGFLAGLLSAYDIDEDLPEGLCPLVRPRILHGDPLGVHFLKTKNGVVAIDWQCPAIGQPSDDVAIYLSASMQNIYGSGPLAPNEVAAFWQGYHNPEVRRQYEAYAEIYERVIHAYCLHREEIAPKA